MRQPLHISIEAIPYHNQFSSTSSSPSSSSAHPSPGTTATSPSSTISDGIICSVLCMYDFQSQDPTHLSFSKNEILDIIKQEESGWWAAMRKGGDVVGWIPQAFVKRLTEQMAERLWNVREELRVYEYEAEQLYVHAPTSRIPFDDDVDPVPPVVKKRFNGYRSDGESRRENRRQDISKSVSPEQQRLNPVLSPVTPQPKYINKPTPPTPNDSDTTIEHQQMTARRPLPLVSSSGNNNETAISPSSGKRNVDKVRQLTGSNEATDFYKLAWYLKPRYGDQIQIDDEGRITSGTRIALVEKLVWNGWSRDFIRRAEDTQYRRIFLTTFRTFMIADELFDMLVGFYRMERPQNVTDAEYEDWGEKRLLPTQHEVFTLFTLWLEEHRLLEEEPHIAGRLTEFVNSITTGPHTSVANGIFQTIKRLTFATPATISPVKTSRRRRGRHPKNDLLKLDSTDVAEQLTLLEYRLYAKITDQECLNLAKSRPSASSSTGPSSKSSPPPKVCLTLNLDNFCATHDKLAAWVTSTILNNDQLSRRADTVDFWIKVAEKCRIMNNFASMSAIINALSSTNVSRLHLTWAHVGRRNTLESLLRYNKPTGGFSGYRKLQLQAEGPCVPFVGMYMNDIAHIKDQFSDEPGPDGQISFLQRQRWYEVVKVMLRSQGKAYSIAENEPTMGFISNNLRQLTQSKDWSQKFWTKSQEVQQSELAHADIRRGLEAAGF
ncbi:ras GEF [Dendrothele bispora CBS 962.96]|uniref:Ras GEF n=1 Tax=Dendrothele bispora (strain CBS 962.96) TaxID=1314807 RepID=A0A4S8MTY6_DENBC|nr:ras GEF [Dendrothele bispora CBS 962.96]